MFWTGVSADDRINGAVQTGQDLQIFIYSFIYFLQQHLWHQALW